MVYLREFNIKEKLLKKINMKKISFIADCLMVVYSLIMAAYYFMLSLISAPSVSITGLPDWEIFKVTLGPVFYLSCSFAWLFCFAIWELMALRDYDKLKEQKNPRVF